MAQVHTPAANTNAAVTLAAGSYRQKALGIVWSYSGAPTGGRLTVVSNSVTKLDIDVIAGGPGFVPFPIIADGPGDTIVITLYAGGAGISGKLSVIEAVDV